MPQGTIHSNGWRSLSTFTASPWVVTPRDTCTPIEPILRSPTQTPVKGCGPDLRYHALLAQCGHDRPLHHAYEVPHAPDGHDRVGHQLAGPVVGHAPAAVAVLDLDPLEPVPLLAHRQVGRLGAAPARIHRRMLEHEEHVGNLAGLAEPAKRLLQRRGLAVGHETKLCDPELVHLSKATLPPVDPEERFWPHPCPLAAEGRVDVADLRGADAARRAALHLLPPVGTGVDLIPAILIAVFGNLGAGGGRWAAWLARRLWARRPAAEPGAPPMAQLEVLTDRVGTGLLVASLVGVLAAGLAAWPLVVAETDARERAANAILRLVDNSGNAELIRNKETAQTVRLGDGYFRTCIAHDDRRKFWCYFIDANKRPVEAVRDPSGLRTGRSTRPCRLTGSDTATLSRSPAPTSNSSTRLCPGRSESSRHQHREVLVRATAQPEAPAGGPHRPVHRHGHVAQAARWTALELAGHADRDDLVLGAHVPQEPRVGQRGSHGACASRPRPLTCRPIRSGCDPTR